MARSSDAHPVHAADSADQAARLSHKLARADALAAERGLALTTLRRQVYALIAQSERPIGAYDLLTALEPEHGFVHRIESKNAFFACCQMGEPHQSQFLMCDACGETLEIPGDGLAAQLSGSAPAHGFEVHHQVVELSGLCAACKHGHP
jgi:Fur family zinc uptake transcriptional regulator